MSEPQANSRRNSTYIVLAVGAVFLAVIVFQQMATFPSAYSEKILQSREAKDLRFRNDPDSPIPQEEKETFSGLTYYSVNDDFRIPANLTPSEDRDTLKLLTTTGEYRQVINYGTLYFTLKGKPYSLLAYKYTDVEVNTLFVPFTDETTGNTTYGGGRYMDIPISEDWTVDFNEAYSPYCIYNETYSCPIPPRQNHIKESVTAGELTYVSGK